MQGLARCLADVGVIRRSEADGQVNAAATASSDDDKL